MALCDISISHDCRKELLPLLVLRSCYLKNQPGILANKAFSFRCWQAGICPAYFLKVSSCCHVRRSSLQTEVFLATVNDSSELLFLPFILLETICVVSL